MLNNPTFFIDLLTASWVTVFSCLLFIWLPSWLLKSDQHKSWSGRIASGFVRMFTLVTIGSLLWIMLGLSNWFTSFLTLMVSGIMVWMFAVRPDRTQRLQWLTQNLLPTILAWFERGIKHQQPVQKSMGWQQQRIRLFSNPNVIIASIAIVIIAFLAIYLRFSYPLSELRFSQPNSYSHLLTIQQILGREYLKLNSLPIFPAFVAFTSLLSAVDAIHTQHFSGAILGCWLVGAIGYGMWGLTRNLSASAVTMMGLGVYLFTSNGTAPTFLSERLQSWLATIMGSLNQSLIRQWNPAEAEIGALFLVLGIVGTTQFAHRYQRSDGWIDTICCVVMVTMAAPPLLLLFLLGGLGMVFGPRVALFALSIAWIFLAFLAAIPDRPLPLDPIFLTTLPIGLSFLFGLFFLLTIAALTGLLSKWLESFCLIVFMAISVNFWLPQGQLPNYLEYDAAARKTVEIGQLFPFKSWTLVAPIEQFPQSYYHGWYEDLAKFVTTYQDQVSNPDFRLPFKTPNVFVLVEKKPFGADQVEADVPYSVFVDPVYRNYRSVSGRTKLQSTALQLCETYAKHHPDSKIYYEDRVLKIYQFRGQPDLKK